MTAENYLVNISGTALGLNGSHAVSLVLLCGVSGNSVIPLKTMSDGTLLVSGPS